MLHLQRTLWSYLGGAGRLYVAEGLQAVDTAKFPQHLYSGASAARDYLPTLKDEKELDREFFSPALEMHPGLKIGRTGKYRLEILPVFID